MDIKTLLSLMENFTKKYHDTFDVEKSQRELICLLEMYPALFEEPGDEDFYVGKTLEVPIHFGLDNKTINSDYLGYIFDSNLMDEYYSNIQSKNYKNRLNELKDYWVNQTFKDVLKNKHNIEISKGINLVPHIDYFDLDYGLLLRKGILGIRMYLESINTNDFIDSALQCMYLLEVVIDYYIHILKVGDYIHKDLMLNTLMSLKKFPPKTYHEASQLIYLYKQISSIEECNNIEDHLSEYIKEDTQEKYISEYNMLVCKKDVNIGEKSKIIINIMLKADILYKQFKITKGETSEKLIEFISQLVNVIYYDKKFIVSALKNNYSFIFTSILNETSLKNKMSIIDSLPIKFVIDNQIEFIEEIAELSIDDMEINEQDLKARLSKILKIEE